MPGRRTDRNSRLLLLPVSDGLAVAVALREPTLALVVDRPIPSEFGEHRLGEHGLPEQHGLDLGLDVMLTWLPMGDGIPHPDELTESAEELGVAAEPDAAFGDRPFFLTMTETVGPPAARHVDVSLWFALAGRVGQPLHPDQREFAGVRWWTAAELRRAGLARFEPHLLRALDALGLDR